MVQQLESILGGPEGASTDAQAQPTSTLVSAPSPEPLLAPDEASRPPVVQALDMTINQAVKDRASDVHIEPAEDHVRIRYRIDGVLQMQRPRPRVFSQLLPQGLRYWQAWISPSAAGLRRATLQ
jgi:type II secretory ATPase GspE/PulE/Tfp pilus assembly ATPase PilB-like protein